MASPLVITDLDSSNAHRFRGIAVSELGAGAAVAEVQLLGAGSLLLRTEDPVTQRATGALKWRLMFPPASDAKLGANTSRRVKSLITSWYNRGTQLQLTGADLHNLDREPLDRVIDGASANKQFISAYPWWGSGEAVYQDGVLIAAADYTVSADNGWLTFDSVVSAGVEVTVTVVRQPKVRVIEYQPRPENGRWPVRWECTATLREDAP